MQETDIDANLIREGLSGNRSALRKLTDRYRAMVLGAAYGALRNHDDAQDVAQEALVFACLHLGELREPERIAGWLKSITLSRCADYRRRRGTRRLGAPISAINEASEEKSYAEAILIRKAVASLSEAHRVAFLLHHEGGWSVEETAELLDIPLNTVRSRLQHAKRHLRAELDALSPESGRDQRRNYMSQTLNELTATHLKLIENAFPGAEVLDVKRDPEAWQPFTPRVRLKLADGGDKEADFRGDLDPAKRIILDELKKLGVPVPQVIGGLESHEGGFLALCEKPRGENLGAWALGGTPHRIRLATERAFEAIDLLQGATEGLKSSPAAPHIPTITLMEEAKEVQKQAGIRGDAWFRSATEKMMRAVEQIDTPLAYTHYLHFFPGSYRIEPGMGAYDEPLGWPGDERYQENPLAEIVSPFGHFGDPYAGLAMVWVYDCYPFVHAGFVEQYLWRHGIAKREFAPRLAMHALRIIARELPKERPQDDAGYWDSLHGYVEQAFSWL